MINYTTSFATPDHVRDEWATHGLPQFTGDEYTAALDAVATRLGVNLDNSRANSTDTLLEKGIRRLGWHVDAIPRNVHNCDLDNECGRCGLGCRIGAKQSTTKTWLADAATDGARLIVGARARKVLQANGAAVGVEALLGNGGVLTVKSRAVVASAGAIQTPALLHRSGLSNTNIGRHLRLHPGVFLTAEFEEEVRGWEGGLQTRFSTEHADLDGRGYGVVYETAPATPAVMGIYTPWHGAADYLDRMKQFPRLSHVIALVRDQGSGRVRTGRDSEPVVRYRLQTPDLAHVRKGFDGATRILEAAGAKRIFSPQQRGHSYAPGQDSRDAFLAECDTAGYGPAQCPFSSVHIMGTARMGGSAKTSATNPDGVAWEVANLVVADGSSFPTASGVNPMISIEAIAYMNSRRLAPSLE